MQVQLVVDASAGELHVVTKPSRRQRGLGEVAAPPNCALSGTTLVILATVAVLLVHHACVFVTAGFAK